ncbi:MAG: metallophosphoesterase [Clostridia bacterium]|nr:metallophosphoesterase [Clostridia bacterium]
MERFQTKYPLRFSKNGEFRLLMMSDIQESAACDPRSLRSVCALLDEARPDLVVWGGDNCYGPEISSLDDLKAFLDIFTRPMIDRGIPWAHVFGNHDHDVPCDPDAMQALYESYPLCVSRHTDATVHGKTNFVLPVFDRTGEKVKFSVWGLDTNNHASDLDSLVKSGDMRGDALLPNNVLRAGNYDILHFDQLMWYWNTSCMLEKLAGEKVPGLLCMHIAPYEFALAAANPEKCVRSGIYVENLDPGILNSGLFAEILQRGDIRTVCCGHTHMNDFEAELCGIRLCWDACAGYRCYGTDSIRGGRLFVIREDDPTTVETKMIHTLSAVSDRG